MNGDTPFHSACYHGHVTCLRVLVAAAKHVTALALREHTKEKEKMIAQQNMNGKNSALKASIILGGIGLGGSTHKGRGGNFSHIEPCSPFPFEPFTPCSPLVRHDINKGNSNSGGNGTGNSTSGGHNNSGGNNCEKEKDGVNKAAIATCCGSKDIAKHVLSLITRENGSKQRPIDVLHFRLNSILIFEKWPQINIDNKKTVLKSFKLAISWFDETWGVKIDIKVKREKLLFLFCFSNVFFGLFFQIVQIVFGKCSL